MSIPVTVLAYQALAIVGEGTITDDRQQLAF